eukprot:gene38012-46184_t
MLIQSFFLLSNTGEVLIEKHWRSVTPRSVCDFFWAEASKYSDKQDLPPVLSVSNYYIVNVQRSELFFTAALTRECNVLQVVDFLHRVADTLEEYFQQLDEDVVKDHFSLIYQLLEEMVDFGFALVTEPSLLKGLIPPPSLVAQLAQAVTFNAQASSSAAALSETLSESAVSFMPWRRGQSVHHATNEIYLDIVEELDAVLDRGGALLACEVHGSVEAVCRLSGLPDLTLTFNYPQLVRNCALHPCVRLGRFEKEGVLSFVPPDGAFTLMRYRLARPAAALLLPLSCQPSLRVQLNNKHSGSNGSGGEALVTVLLAMRSPHSLVCSGGAALQLEEVEVVLPFSRRVRSAALQASQGRVLFDEASKTLFTGDLVFFQRTLT